MGITRSTAADFFARLEAAGVRAVVDLRLKARSQLAGFAEQPDLALLLARVSGIAGRDEPLLAPAPAAFDAYRRGEIDWDAAAGAYLRRLREREVAARLDPAVCEGACLLCRETDAGRCHRRLAADHLASAWPGDWRVVHR